MPEDTDELRSALKRTDDQIAEERRHIEHERGHIERAKQSGHDPTTRQKSLLAMHHFLDALNHHRRILLERLGFYRP